MAEPSRSIRVDEKYLRLDGVELHVETTVTRAKFVGGKAFIVNLRTGQRPPSDVVREWEANYHLTSAEAFVLRNAAHGRSRTEIRASLRVAASTVKKHVHNLVQKTGDASLNVAVQRLLREAMRR
jgi:DNA-binding NarL/FixJ family response regulator